MNNFQVAFLITITMSLILPCQSESAEPTDDKSTLHGIQQSSTDQKQKLITLSKETTYYTQPLDQHGFVDYLAAINADLGKGITAENNAAVQYFQATSNLTEKMAYKEKMSKLLGIAIPLPRNHDPDLSSYLHKQAVILHGENFKASSWVTAQMTKCEQPWKSADHPEVKAFIDQYQPTFDLLRAARDKTEYFMPYVTDEDANKPFQIMSAILFEIQEMRSCARALNIKIMLDLGESNFSNAKEDLLTLRAMSRNVSRGATLIELLVGYAINAMAFLTENEFANSCSDVKILEDYYTGLRQLPSERTISQAIDKCERLMSIDLISSLARNEYGSVSQDDLSKGLFNVVEFPYTMMLKLDLNWDEVLKSTNQNFDRMLAESVLPRRERLDKHRVFLEEVTQYKNELLEPNVVFWNLMSKKVRSENVGKLISSLNIPSLSQAFTAEDQNKMRAEIIKVLIKLNIYKLREGTYPGSLEELATKYHQEIPIDLFADAPLKYTSDGKTFTLYSVGRNSIDDGGRSSYDDPKSDDLVVKKEIAIRN